MFQYVLKLSTNLTLIATITAFASSLAYGQASTSYAAVQGTKGGQDMFGAYEVDEDWPKDISTLPGAAEWTFGAGQSVFAEHSNRIFYMQRGLLTKIKGDTPVSYTHLTLPTNREV